MDFDRLIREYANKGYDFNSAFGTVNPVDLGGNSLSGNDALTVGRYWALTGGGRNEEWIHANPTEFWQRQLRDAQNWLSLKAEDYGKTRAAVINDQIQKKMTDLDMWRQQMQSSAGADRATIQAQYQQQVAALQSEHQKQIGGLQSSIGQAANAAGIQEQFRASQEKLRQLGDWGNFVSSYNLDPIDQDSYQGEEAQAGSFKDFLSRQLGGAGYDAGGLLGGYDLSPEVSGSRGIMQNFNTYRNSLYGSDQSQQGNALGIRSTAGQQLSQYDQTIRDKLANLGQVYQAYQGLGDINAQTGATAQDRVMGLFGYQKPDVEGAQREFGEMGTGYQKLAGELGMLYGGDGAPTGLVNQQMDKWGGISGRFNPAVQGLLSTYGSAASTLHGLYGDIEAVRTGRIRSEASRQGGLLSSATGQVTSVLGDASTAATRLQDLYNQTASTLRAQRITEGSQIREQNLQRDFTERQNRLLSMTATTLSKPGQRTAEALRRPVDILETQQQPMYDPLGLTRGYSLLGG